MRSKKNKGSIHHWEALGKLSAGVAHDFNHILSLILTRTSYIQQKYSKNDPLYLELDRIIKAAQMGARLSGQILSLVKGGSDKSEYIEINEFLSQFIQMIKPLIGNVRELKLVPLSESLFIRIKRGALEQIFLNLIINAHQAMAMSKSGKIEIEVSRKVNSAKNKKSFVQVKLKDNGIGMNARVLKQVFLPFYTTSKQGTGLGLFQVKSLIEAAKGSIVLSSKLNQGTEVRLTFPISQSQDKSQKQLKSIGRDPIKEKSASILLIEDEADLRNLLKDILNTQGFRAMDPGPPSGIIEYLKNYSGSVDLVLLDLVMPGVDGLKLINHLKKVYPSLKIIIVSGNIKSIENVKLKGKAPLFYLAKPFSPSELFQKIQEALS